jgi:hypothetical protein
MYFTHVHAAGACQHLCDLHAKCQGFVYIPTSIKICIGLNNVDWQAHIHASELRHVLGIEDPLEYELPVCAMRAL